MARLLSLAAFITSVLTAALDTRQAGAGLRTDNYDGLTTVPAVPQLSLIGQYNGLDYKGWTVAQGGLPLPNLCLLGDRLCLATFSYGLKPQSPAKIAVTGLVQTVTQIGLVSLRPFGTISAVPSQGVNSYNLISFYFGCIGFTAESLVTFSSRCSITVTGFYTTGVQAPTLKFTFVPTSATESQLTKAVLPASYSASLAGLKNVTIGIAEADWTPALTVLGVDDLVHLNRVI
ncbi:hypothetical protein CB0940_04956 [Cercospora beticola]|uniref:Uncharacterized protein n=1 Tax=Cercospora beticola TaxID=122368 RepID=A0A2G5HIZ9_CERBT|nr:hypothetical protein CB0940_04956 [Cercospora beticola]PIA92534.1 hypothetical protein CB0940_04956 [Cercospora beticola]WPB02243.1 hypothetical protein RHO25_006877 [Cercospora beticola]CAK1362891.1 unnamed protein product [Cercospora beticola]